MSVEGNDFLTEQIQAQKAKREGIVEEKFEETVVDPIEEKEVEVQDAVVTPEPTPVEKEEVTPAAPRKIKVEYQEWLESNKGTIQEYLSQKDKDYSLLSHEEAVALKLRRENPYFDSKDVKAELQEKYGIGLTKVEIDHEDMSPEEIREAERTNALIERGQRVLKAEGEKAKKELEEYKNGLALPEFEYEVSLDSSQEGEPFDQEAVQKQVKEYRDQVWVPELNKAVSEVSSVKRSITFDDNGTEVTLDVELGLTKEDQEALVKGLTEYVPQASDAKYSKEDGTTDVKQFLQDKAQEVFIEKLIKQAASQAYLQAKKGVIKSDLLNFDGGIRPTSPGAPVEKTRSERVVDKFFEV